MRSKLDYITVVGFRSIRRVEKLPLRPINVLIGANGSGKSNFIGVFSFLHAIRQGRLVEYAEKHGLADNILHFGSKQTSEIFLEVSFENELNRYNISLVPTDQDRFYVHSESCYVWDRKKYPDRPFEEGLSGGGGREAAISHPQTKRTAKWVRARLESWRTYHFHDTSETSPMRKTANVNDNRLFRSDGSNLAAYLYLLRERHPSEYDLIRKVVRQAAPFFDNFQLAPLRRNESLIKLEWNHTSSDRYFDAAALSDGTLRFICLATLFLQPAEYRPSVIIVDEPELGLHPFAITMLASMTKSAAKQTQVIVSTQSPLLLDHFEPEDVLVAERKEGATTLTRPNPDELADWLQDYSLGQLWEKNQIGGRPSRG